ncbi:MAG: hypothetical protein P8188_19660, partial [Gemmatimonadota bacterium]
MSQVLPWPTAPRGRPEAPLDALLGRLRLRIAVRTLLRSGAVALLAALSVAAALVALDGLVSLPVPARSLLRWLPVLPLFLPPLAVTRALRRTNDARLALLLDERGGAGNVASTLQTPNATGVTAELFRARAVAALRAVDPRAVVPLEATRLWVVCFAALGSAVLVVGALGAGEALSARWLHPEALPVVPGERIGEAPP